MYEADIGDGVSDESSMGNSTFSSGGIAAGACDIVGSFGSTSSAWTASMELFLGTSDRAG